MGAKVKIQTKTIKPLSIFLNSTVGLDATAGALRRIVGHALTRQESDVGVMYRTHAFCIELSLFDNHGLDDDAGIPFTDFVYQLQLVALRAGMEIAGFASMYEGIGVFLASKISTEVGCRALVVANLQRVLADFDPDPNWD